MVLAVGMPLALFFAAEIALRLAHFGYSTKFVIPDRDQPGILTENPRYGWRFFPRGSARVPDPIRVAKQKSPNTFRIFVFGESAALGDPASAYGLSRFLSVLLSEKYPGAQFEVINTAMTAINSNVILPIAEDVADLHGDCWVFYTGNNEVVGPFGNGGVFGAAAPPRWMIRANLALRSLRIGQLLEALTGKLRNGAAEEWRGMEMMLKSETLSDDPRLRRIYANFSANLHDCVAVGVRSNAKIIVSSMVANLKDCPPFASRHRSSLSTSDLTRWEKFFRDGQAALESGNFSGALTNFESARALDDQYAGLAFCLGLAKSGARDNNGALNAFEKARDLDTLRFRCDSELNDRIRSIATQAGANVRFVNAFDQIGLSATNPPGTNIFLDHVHFTFHGNYLFARAIAAEVGQALQLDSKNAPIFPNEEECAARLAFTDWDRALIEAEMLERFRRAPFTNQFQSNVRLRNMESNVTILRQRALANLPQAVAIYRQALANRPHDFVLHDRFAAALEAAGDYPAAESEWKRALEILPQSVDATFKVGTMAARLDQNAEAESWFRKTLTLRPTSVEARNELGLALAAQGKTNEAFGQFKDALEVRPSFAEGHVNWGLILFKAGALDLAKQHYRAALAINPNLVAAHANYGKLLVSEKQFDEGIAQFKEALKLRPDDPAIHFSLAGVYQNANRLQDAQNEYETVVRLEPAFALAQLNLGVLLANADKRDDARKHFQAAADADPKLAEAEFYLGMTYLQDGKPADGAAHLKKALEINPNHEQARSFLDRLRRQPAQP
jgi:tetratricopeptide (TPR) repeat protein